MYFIGVIVGYATRPHIEALITPTNQESTPFNAGDWLLDFLLGAE